MENNKNNKININNKKPVSTINDRGEKVIYEEDYEEKEIMVQTFVSGECLKRLTVKGKQEEENYEQEW